MRLYLIPDNEAVRCDWDSFLDLVEVHYGKEVGRMLHLHKDNLKSKSLAEIQGEDLSVDLGILERGEVEPAESECKESDATLSIENVRGAKRARHSYGDPSAFDTTKYLASKNRLVDARAFLYHELGLNSEADLPFTQDRNHKWATLACMVPNRLLDELPADHCVDILPPHPSASGRSEGD